jgi:lysyl-tRNA synthetase class 1
MFWADELAEKLSKRSSSQTVATAITPSGPIHVGNLREVTVGDVLNRALIKKKQDVRFIYIADDYDRLRKVYPFLPAEYEKYVGMPLTSIPDPAGDCHGNYGEHYISDFFENLPKMGIEVERLSATQLYKSGFYTQGIKIAIQNKSKIKKILEDVAHRTLPDDWNPYVAYCSSCGKDFTKISKEDLDNNKVFYTCQCGQSDWSDFSKGEGKLVWRVDWPMRWSVFKVTSEPLGKDHNAAGGSFDTAKIISQEVYGWPAPEKVFYEFVYLKETSGKMSSSLGNVVSSSEMLAIVPPQVLRYFLIKNKDRHVVLDPGRGLIQLIDEYTRFEKKIQDNTATAEEKELYEYTKITNQDSRANIPFNHLVNVYQSAQGNTDEVMRLLERSDHIGDKNLIIDELERVKNWLDNYAPDDVKFTIEKDYPKDIVLTDIQKQLLSKIIENIDIDAEALHNYIYTTGKELGLSAKETFEAVYKPLLNQTSGPKVGWFLKNLDRDFVVKRLKEAIGE